MGHGKKHARRWNLLDVVSAAFFVLVAVFFLLVFTPLGDSLAASGRRELSISAVDARERGRILRLAESGQPLEACPDGAVHRVPCDGPRKSGRAGRDRRCPPVVESSVCLVAPPRGYRIPIPWPESLNKVWHINMPHNKIHEAWMKEDGPYFDFSDGGTMFPDGAGQYIEKLAQYIPIGKRVLRTALDMDSGVASFGGLLLSQEMLTLSFSPRDSDKSQIQFALERGIPSLVAMLGTQRLPFPAHSFDLVHCSQCFIAVTAQNGTYFAEVDRILRPGGFFVISGPPVQWDNRDKEWADLQAVARALCYELIVVEGNTVIWKKPVGDSCLPNQNEFGLDLCSETDDPNSAWYVELNNCISRSSLNGNNAVESLPNWPLRLNGVPLRAALIKNGGSVFQADTKRWARRVAHYKSLVLKLGSPSVRNVMDMNAFFGGFAASLVSDPIWVMNVVPACKPLTLGVIYDRGLIGVYHDWCEPFSTYPRSYDLIHVSGIDSLIRDAITGNYRCDLVDLMVEMDRILRPEGTVIMRDSPDIIERAAQMARSIKWTATMYEAEAESSGKEKVLVATKEFGPLPVASL